MHMYMVICLAKPKHLLLVCIMENSSNMSVYRKYMQKVKSGVTVFSVLIYFG